MNDPGQFETCMEPGCVVDATFITLVDGELKCYCDEHGAKHVLDRGRPWESAEDYAKRMRQADEIGFQKLEKGSEQ